MGTVTSVNRAPLPNLEINNNINDYFLKNNPPKWVNSQTSVLGQAINNNIQNNIPNFDSNTVIISRGKNQQIPKYDKIFTQEEIGNLTKEEFTKHEKEIQGQWGSIGIPSESELHTSGAIYVEPYTRSDGVQVKGHYRSR